MTAPARVVVSTGPLNAETPPEALLAARTPTDVAYVRTNFGVPTLDPATHVLHVGGAVRTPVALDLATLAALPQHTVETTMECAGNDRLAVRPFPAGEPWGGGALSTGRWTGVPLATLLEHAGIDGGAVEVLASGADAGPRADADEPGPVRFARSLPIAEALAPDTLVALARDDQPLRAEHGAPVRLIVPGWYGMASVKWLTRLDVLTRPFDGYFQRLRYVYDEPGAPTRPVTRMPIKSIIVAPAEGAAVARGPLHVWGWAWSGTAPVTRVQIALGGGEAWTDARLEAPASPHAWARWDAEVTVGAPGRVVLRSRATDASGAEQPERAPWNRLGYGNNAVRMVTLRVEG